MEIDLDVGAFVDFEDGTVQDWSSIALNTTNVPGDGPGRHCSCSILEPDLTNRLDDGAIYEDLRAGLMQVVFRRDSGCRARSVPPPRTYTDSSRRALAP